MKIEIGLNKELTVSKLSKESTATAFVAFSLIFISRLYLVLHSVTRIVAAKNVINNR